MGDFARHYDTAVGGLSSFFVWLNRGKESVTLDLKAPGAAAVLDRLLDKADVLVQNLGPGAARRLGLDAATLRATRPSLIVASVSGYGTDGPWRDRKAYDLLIQAETGLLSLTGTEETMTKVPISVADISAGMHLFAAVMTAVLVRERTGIATPVEVSLFDSMADWLGMPLHFTAGAGHQPPANGTHHATIAPYGSFIAADGRPVIVAVQNEREWAIFCRDVLGQPELIADPHFASNPARARHRSELDSIIGAFCAHHDADGLLALLGEAGIAASRLNSVDDLLRHPVLAERDRWREVESPVGAIRTLRSPIDVGSLGEILGSPSKGIPDLGEHTDRVLLDLGLSEKEISRLREDQVV